MANAAPALDIGHSMSGVHYPKHTTRCQSNPRKPLQVTRCSRIVQMSARGGGKRFERMTKRQVAAVLAILGAGILLRASFFAISVTRIPPAMDECITALQSKQMIEARGTPAARAKRHPQPVLGRFPLLFMTQPYLFPMDAYLNVPFIAWTPRTAFGIRLMPMCVGLLGTALTLMILLRITAARDAWPGVLLIAAPSTYLLMLVAGYTPPSYVSFLMWSALITWLALKAKGDGWRVIVWAGVAGIASGLAVSTQMIVAPLVVSCFLLFFLRRKIRLGITAAAAFGAGGLLGLGPILLGMLLYPGAHRAVSGLHHWRHALERIWAPALSYTLPTALGLPCTIFADNENRVGLFPGIGMAALALWGLMLVCASVLALAALLRRVRRQDAPLLTIWDMLILHSWLTPLMFAFSARAYSHSFRYLLGVVWAFPFLVAFCYRGGGRVRRILVGGAAVVLAVLNVATATAVMRNWASAGFARDIPRIYDLEPAIRYLRERGIDRCYANYFDTYRINYMTDEEILGSQHYNVRFYGWPLPYKQEVDAATNVAYVLGPAWRFPPEQFEQDLEAMGVTCRKEQCGAASVYTDFRFEPQRTEYLLPPESFAVETSCMFEDARYLQDGVYGSRWNSRQTQTTNMWMEIRLGQAVPICRVNLYYNYYAHDMADALTLRARTADGWDTPVENAPRDIEAFVIRNGHPVYGDQTQTFRFEPVVTDCIRIELAVPSAGRNWTMGEIELYSAEPPAPAASDSKNAS